MRAAPLALSLALLCGSAPPPGVKLEDWERGIAVRSVDRPDLALYLWFYEWHMFDAVRKGQHTGGSHRHPHRVSEDGTTGAVDAGKAGLELTMKAVADGAELALKVTNTSDHDWPELAAFIPCFSPGLDREKKPRTPEFANEKTWFLSAGGLKLLRKREIHFNAKVRKKVDAEARDGRYVWSPKWPLAEPDATAGLLIRESNDGKWVTGIAWENFLSSQGHNPWRCMHLSVRVGPLARGKSRKIRGRIWLFKGSKADCLRRFEREFGKEIR